MDFAPGRGQTARERPSQMLDATPFTIGADVSCSDGSCGELTRVVVDPITRSATHLVVDPKHRRGLGRLVPIALITEATAEIQLNCTTEQFSALHHAEETQFSPGNLGPSGYGSFLGTSDRRGTATSTPCHGRTMAWEEEGTEREPVTATECSV